LNAILGQRNFTRPDEAKNKTKRTTVKLKLSTEHGTHETETSCEVQDAPQEYKCGADIKVATQEADSGASLNMTKMSFA
jgi:hypothetical protein